MLKYGEMSMIEIANHLSFSSQSHFIQQFRDATGVTPKKYRDENAKLKWDR
ncbi:helix-turn-helix domain-containing protein [Streptococcus suis]|uniref:helix-turn-helix domain-containing protein n=1 Tax=Streptococcus suis TaxID=1307 RepID=UPI0021BBFCDC|nr:AraC family transcriptional regulator [Streptococcus suis]MDX5052353.1 AraC family transcriptional regulator [Streptococcus suis]